MNDTPNCTHRQFTENQSYCPDCGLSQSEILVAACEPYLKDGESPAECIARNRRDVDGCLTMLIEERRKADALAARLAEAEALLRELLTTADCDRPPPEDRIDAFLGATMGNSRRHKAGWIPCDIRLPERDGYYLTYDASTPGAGDEYLVAEFDVRRGCFEDESIGFIPTHWMDLPEPPARGMRAPIEEAGRE